MFQGIHSFEDFINKVKENQNQILVTLFAVIFTVGGVFGYLYYQKHREQSAYHALSEALEYFDAPIKKADSDMPEDDLSFLDRKEFASDTEKWGKVASVCESAYSSHRSAGIAPMFLVYQSEAMLKLNKLSEAIKLLRTAIARMKNDAVKEYYSVKLALLQIDSEDTAVLTQGVELLKSVALKESSVAHDLALYHLGLYYWHEKNFVEASNYWNQLILAYGKLEKNQSPWVAVAKTKLRLIDSDVE